MCQTKLLFYKMLFFIGFWQTRIQSYKVQVLCLEYLHVPSVQNLLDQNTGFGGGGGVNRVNYTAQLCHLGALAFRQNAPLAKLQWSPL